MQEFKICKADTPELYRSLRGLWCEVFGDPPEFVDTIYDIFGSDISGYVMADEEGKVAAAVTCYRCGAYEIPAADEPDLPEMDPQEPLQAYVSYAVCTAPEFRGRGFASELTAYVRDKVLAEGGVSIVSPATEELISFYDALGYRPCFTSSEQAAFADMASGFGEGWEEDEDDFDDYEPFEPELSVIPADPDTYNKYREAFLAGVPHIVLTNEMLEAVRAESAGGDGLLIINGGDAICVLADDGQMTGEAVALELLVNPMLADISFEIEGEIAARLARGLGVFLLKYRSDGQMKLQSMIALPDDKVYRDGSYFGFPLD